MKAIRVLSALTGVLSLWLGVVAAAADSEQNQRPFLHPLFSDHVELQRHVKVPVWGWASPGSKITVTFAGQTRSASAGPDGKWQVRLERMEASAEPRVLQVTDGSQTVTVNDVLVGD